MARKKAEPKPKLTAAERHKRFVETAREVGADERPEAFDRAFRRVAKAAPRVADASDSRSEDSDDH
jgi:hypothetical protein